MPRDPNVPTLRHSGYPVGMTRPAPRSGAFHPLLAVAALAVSLAASASSPPPARGPDPDLRRVGLVTSIVGRPSP